MRIPGVFLSLSLLALSLFPGSVRSGDLQLPAVLQGKAEVLAATDPDYARADIGAAVKTEGQGGISQGLVLRLTADVPVYRMWNGPTKKDSRGNTNRMGQWWSYDAPKGDQAGYRKDYEICLGWNDLTWMATCTLKKGAVVVVGPGQSVTAQTCGDPTGQENYHANAEDWQVYVAKAWARGAELSCPPDSADYEVDPANIEAKKP